MPASLQGLVPGVLAAIAVLLVTIAFLVVALGRTRREIRTLRGQLHGARVRGGHVAESLAPLVEDFPVDVDKPDTATVFLGQPIDYIHFDPEEGITFIEVKTGRSGLSARQRKLRDLVKDGRVTWHTHRMP